MDILPSDLHSHFPNFTGGVLQLAYFKLKSRYSVIYLPVLVDVVLPHLGYGEAISVVGAVRWKGDYSPFHLSDGRGLSDGKGILKTTYIHFLFFQVFCQLDLLLILSETSNVERCQFQLFLNHTARTVDSESLYIEKKGISGSSLPLFSVCEIIKGYLSFISKSKF